MTKMSTLGWWGAITLGPPRGHFGPEGEPCGQNLDPRGWGAITMGTP